jgi:hypothetical protein
MGGELPQGEPLGPHADRRAIILFTILFTVYERAFYDHRNNSKHARDTQWSGWELSIKRMATRPIFIKTWRRLGDQFDLDFKAEMDKILAKAHGTSLANSDESEPPAPL